MNKLKTTLALISVFAVMLSAFSCGKTNSESSGSAPAVGDTTEIVTDSEGHTEIIVLEKTSDDNPESKTDPENSASANGTESNAESTQSVSGDEKNSAGSGENTAQNSGSDKQEENSGSSSENPPAGNTVQNGGGSASSGNTNQQQSGGSSSGGDTSSSGGSSSGGGSASDKPASQTPTQAPVSPEEEEITYTASISLGSSSSFTGSNVSIDGSHVLINAGGDYYVSGTLSGGQLEVNTTEKVKLYFDGVNISNPNGPAILITDAKRIEIKLLSGTVTNLSDGGKDKICDGAIFTNDTIEIKGKGTLNIIANNAHGIASDDDIIIQNGNINITSVKSGLIAHDDITINDGTLSIFGGTNGIKSKNTININGGYSTICGGTKEEKSSVYAAGAFNYTGGTVFAAGNTVSAPTSASNPYVVAGFGTALNGGTKVRLTLNNTQLTEFTPKNSFKCIMLLSPDCKDGSKFGISVGDSVYSSDISGIRNIFTF